MQINSNIISRFWTKVNKTDSCWLWTGALDRRGYGAFSLNKKAVKAHRVSVMLDGRNPTGFDVCHKCDNPACVRPDHLFLGTHADNMTDMKNKGRNHKECKLNEQQVLEIRNLYDTTGTTIKQLTQMYNVSRGAIQGIVERTNWKHI
jgi:hypothetical protein